MNQKEQELDSLRKQAKDAADKQLAELERISGFTSEKAKEYLLQSVKEECTHEMAVLVKDLETKAREEADKKARDIVVNAIQRCSADSVTEATISVVQLPNDEMKGRIIGREGRNIRSIESLTGVDLIIDDTPEAITLSCFDPVRREVARIALEKLIVDGRIHPASIEEKVDKARREVEKRIKQEGERAVLETNVHGLNPELIRLLGRLTFRTSYRQNVLNHSIEVATLSGILASELGVDANMARRAGLLHDIGKAVDHEVEGTHAMIGADLLKRAGEEEDIINAVAAHHEEVEKTSLLAILVQICDALSASRPGARSETTELYLKRLEQLEAIGNSFEGVENCYAIQAGRELRVIVMPEKVSEEKAAVLAHDMAERIEKEMRYPGQVRVSIIRETRAVDYAK
jgi:ribonuclease Y